MSVSQPPNDLVVHSLSSSRPVWGRIVRLLVPVPQGAGVRGKTAWVGRRIVYWYVLILIMLAFFQRHLIYQPTRADSIAPEFSGLDQGRVENVAVQTADGLQLHGWFVRALPAFGVRSAEANNGAAVSHPVVIYFPGNAGHRGYRAIELDLISRLGADVYLFDYRGYGDNPGSPTEEHLASDARAIWQAVTGKCGAKPSNVVVMGESLGGGVATRLAAELCAAESPPGGLILRSTFSSLADVAAYHYWWLPVRMLLIDRFPSAERIASVTCPVLVIHGTTDTIVPLSFGKRLFEAAPQASGQAVPKTFAQLRGAGHNDILYVARDEYRTAMRNFLDHLQSAK
jgi:fermentation-respiration switch protein FrsA (DUF1100 family)